MAEKFTEDNNRKNQVEDEVLENVSGGLIIQKLYECDHCHMKMIIPKYSPATRKCICGGTFERPGDPAIDKEYTGPVETASSITDLVAQFKKKHEN